MRNVIAQFRIEDEALYKGDDTQKEEIKSTVIQRLRNRSAIFDKIVEADYDENLEQLTDEASPQEEFPDPEDIKLTTLVDVTLIVNDEMLEKIEADPDLVYVKALSDIDGEELSIEPTQQSYNVSHIAFRKF
ncbi:MAG TPA: hypothetical protein VGB50_11680 [Flavobacterium sp.]|jgi:hypothetical protein